MSSLHVQSILVLWCIGVLSTCALQHHIALLQTSDGEGASITILPNNGFTEYSAASKDVHITPKGLVYAKNSLKKYAEEDRPLVLTAKDYVTGVQTKHELHFHIPDDYKDMDISFLRRSKRAVTQLSVTKEVEETAYEISIDYANAGVQQSAYNRYYMQNKNDSIPLSVALIDGRLTLTDNSRRMDYETAPNKRYEFNVYINNTLTRAGITSLMYLFPLCY